MRERVPPRHVLDAIPGGLRQSSARSASRAAPARAGFARFPPVPAAADAGRASPVRSVTRSITQHGVEQCCSCVMARLAAELLALVEAVRGCYAFPFNPRVLALISAMPVAVGGKPRAGPLLRGGGEDEGGGVRHPPGP